MRIATRTDVTVRAGPARLTFTFVAVDFVVTLTVHAGTGLTLVDVWRRDDISSQKQTTVTLIFTCRHLHVGANAGKSGC